MAAVWCRQLRRRIAEHTVANSGLTVIRDPTTFIRQVAAENQIGDRQRTSVIDGPQQFVNNPIVAETTTRYSEHAGIVNAAASLLGHVATNDTIDQCQRAGIEDAAAGWRRFAVRDGEIVEARRHAPSIWKTAFAAMPLMETRPRKRAGINCNRTIAGTTLAEFQLALAKTYGLAAEASIEVDCVGNAILGVHVGRGDRVA